MVEAAAARQGWRRQADPHTRPEGGAVAAEPAELGLKLDEFHDINANFYSSSFFSSPAKFISVLLLDGCTVASCGEFGLAGQKSTRV